MSHPTGRLAQYLEWFGEQRRRETPAQLADRLGEDPEAVRIGLAVARDWLEEQTALYAGSHVDPLLPFWGCQPHTRESEQPPPKGVTCPTCGGKVVHDRLVCGKCWRTTPKVARRLARQRALADVAASRLAANQAAHKARKRAERLDQRKAAQAAEREANRQAKLASYLHRSPKT